MNCLACFMELASPWRYTWVCSLLSRTSVTFMDKTASRSPSSLSRPYFFKRFKMASTSALASPTATDASSVRLECLYLRRMAWAFHSSLLFRRPKDLTSSTSAAILSACQGVLGLLYVLRFFPGYPIADHLLLLGLSWCWSCPFLL